jgi:subtilase family serine protease
MSEQIYKSKANVKVSDVTKTGQVITVVTKSYCMSNVSQEDAKKNAYKSAKKRAIEKIRKQVVFANQIIDKNTNIQMKPHYMTPYDAGKEKIVPLASNITPFSGYTPNQLKSIYNVPTITKSGKTRKVSITIIIAYHYPNLKNDFNKFCSLNGLPPYNLNVVSFGSSVNNAWSQEECLDVQWAYAMNPNANIRVIEAKSSNSNHLLHAVEYASNPLNGITDIISMSWGSNEFGKIQIAYDSYFSNTNICYLAASGDTNSVSWPATSPNVLACGGTTLNSSSPNFSTRTSEVTWMSAGCGVSTVYSKPSYQVGVPNLNSYTKRCIPDLSGISNPSRGVQVIYNGNKYIFGGTSVSTPVNAGMLSLGIQQRLNLRKSPVTTSYTKTQKNLLQNLLYKNIYVNKSLYSSNFYDVTKGTDGKYTTSEGFDVSTGLGVQKCSVFTNALTVF